MNISILNVLKNYTSEICLSNKEYGFVKLFTTFILKMYKEKDIKTLDKTIIDEFLYLYFVNNDKYLNLYSEKELIIFIHNFICYVNKNYTILQSNFLEIINIVKTLKRVKELKFNLAKISNNPILNQSPTIIDFIKYKQFKLNKLENDYIEKGYYSIIDIFNDSSILIRNIHTNKFIKLDLDISLIKITRTNDILSLELRKKPNFVWQIENFYNYFPFQAEQFLLKRRGIL